MFLELENFTHLIGVYGPVVAFAIAVFLFCEALFVSVARRRRKDDLINKRMRVKAHNSDQLSALAALRRSRGLTADGLYDLPFASFNRLVMQSGSSVPVRRLLLFMAAMGLAIGSLTYVLMKAFVAGVAAAVLSGLVLPVAVLVRLRTNRIKKFEAQLPEAIDIIVRSLKAGHPLPVAISMVGREMQDPIGTEFGIAADEMTYGLDLETAMSNMRARAGQSDLSFLVVAVSIQSKTGGNLAEILSNLSGMVRARARMRSKVRSLSAEGRFSAIALSVIPLMLATIINLTAPSYFTDVKDDPLFWPAVYLGFGMWAMGIFIMRRMVNFKV